MTVQVLSKNEVRRLLDVPDCRTRHGRRDRALLSVMALGGLRIAEAAGLRREDCHEQDGVMRLTFDGKGGKRRTVTLPRLAADALRDALAHTSGEYCFPAHDRQSTAPLSPRGARYVVTQCFAAAGLPEWVHAHSLRHTCATLLMRQSGDLHMVQRVLGHANPATTAKHYLAWDASDADKAAKLMEMAL